MARLIRTLVVALICTLIGNSSFAADKVIDPIVQIQVKGGIKPGPLMPDDVLVTVIPGRDLNTYYTGVDFCADDCVGQNKFLSFVCLMGNEQVISRRGIPETYVGRACGYHNPVQVPKAKKYFARVRVHGNEKVQTIVVGPFTSVPKEMGDNLCGSRKVPEPSEVGYRKVTVLSASSNYVKDKSILDNRSLCVWVIPQNTEIKNVIIRGGVYSFHHGYQVRLGMFQCSAEHLANKEVYFSGIESCDYAPRAPKLMSYKGPLRIILTVQFQTEGKESERPPLTVPIEVYPPKFDRRAN